MDLKITPMQQLQQIEQAAKTNESDGSFRFTLLSTIEEQELQATLFTMMEEITQQGDKLGKRMDIRDMKNYRRLIKEFMNEIASHTHEFSRENFLDKKRPPPCIWYCKTDKSDLRRTGRRTSQRRKRPLGDTWKN